jgi:hypothetical protein
VAVAKQILPKSFPAVGWSQYGEQSLGVFPAGGALPQMAEEATQARARIDPLENRIHILIHDLKCVVASGVSGIGTKQCLEGR